MRREDIAARNDSDENAGGVPRNDGKTADVFVHHVIRSLAQRVVVESDRERPLQDLSDEEVARLGFVE